MFFVFLPSFLSAVSSCLYFSSAPFLGSLAILLRRIFPSILQVIVPWYPACDFHIAFLPVCLLRRIFRLPLGFSVAGLLSASSFPVCLLFVASAAVAFVGFRCLPCLLSRFLHLLCSCA